VGGTILLANAPPQMTPAQRESIMAFTRAIASSSRARILEHAFFVDGGAPVFYSTYPVPVLTGGHPAFTYLLVDGLIDDIERHCRVTP